MGSIVNRQNMPPKPGEVLWVERIQANKSHRLTVWSNAIWGVWTHWTGSRTQPCFEDHTLCHNGHEEETMRWRGYLHGWSHVKNRAIFMQLTANACWQLLGQVREGSTLRGITIDVSRTQHNKGRLNCQLVNHVVRDADTCPPEMDPLKSLFKLWKVPNLLEALNVKLAHTLDDIPKDEAA